jgi:predicted nucleic acid-binding protein
MAPHEPVLLDTSIWVRCLRPRGAVELKSAVQEQVARGLVATCSIVKTELLTGANNPADFETLSQILGALIEIPMTGAFWDEVARLAYSLRKQGLIVPLPDLAIAQCAISSERILWHTDQDFERIEQRTSLRTMHWPRDD